jgi:hypothetical protein
MRDGLNDLEDKIVNLLNDVTDSKPYYGSYTLDQILEHVKEHDEIKKSKRNRAKKDKLRRLISKSTKIRPYGRTKKKRYLYQPSPIGWEFEDLNHEIMLHNELLGGHGRIEDIAKSMIDKSGFQRRKNENGDYYLPEYGFMSYEKDELLVKEEFLAYLNECIKSNVTIELDTDYVEKWGIPDILYPFEFSNAPSNLSDLIKQQSQKEISDLSFIDPRTTFLKTKPNCWFESGHWLENSYFGFQGPDYLSEIISKISDRIEQISDEKLKDSNVRNEIEWMNRMKKSEKKRHSNKYIFTLALLHLNRSLLETSGE